MKNYIYILTFLSTIGNFQSCSTPSTEKEEIVIIDTVEVEIDSSAYIYAINVDSMTVEQNVVKRNQSLADILTASNVEYKEIFKLANNAKPVFDVRRLKVGKDYTLLFTNDSISKLNYFIYQEDPINYVVFDLIDSCNVYRGEKPVEIVKKEVASDIQLSLYQSLIDLDESPALVNELADVFAWQIDFFHIQKGDAFKVVFYEKEVDGTVVGIDHIEAALFTHQGKDYYAFDYNYNGKKEYFDEFGNSLRKEFLKAPLHFSRISSSFSRKRFHPVQKRYKAHLGTDYAAPIGTPIHSVGDGEIVAAQYSKYNGNYVKVRHNSVYTTQYLHMSKIKKGIRRGVKIKQGDIIGYVGKTGLATGAHLCYRFWKNGKQVDPRRQEIPSSDPLPDSVVQEYQEIIMPIKLELDKVDLITSN
ncbi:hypothetical protein EI427_01435 [Flammeovirga pectinis]|uniref:Uncharacterized protein n=1 Tax=Flammeovirga pectinis TaxID=2494373 RepID=A0A3Q9FM58_9BACT|nr:peptidoglycan DD-metalloendopeptidase family protein [Flammeovirga pectinis]AZQ60922.1 hypothetical protein EI427_01435 [Flammeovirga pectinis]